MLLLSVCLCLCLLSLSARFVGKTVTAVSECGERLCYTDKTNNDPASDRCGISTIKSIVVEAVCRSKLRICGEAGRGR
jgi:hypothetical protein